MVAPGTLRRAVAERTASALASGALRLIDTEESFIEQGGVRFVVRTVSSLVRKDEEGAGEAAGARQTGRRANPFLPYEAALHVADLSDSHVCLLNKFNVIDRHLLIVTRRYEDQENLLTPADFEALGTCMAGFEGLGFYNGGAAAGASQPHKHLQMVPLPLASEGPAIPIAPLLDAAAPGPAAAPVPGLPFAHAFARLDPAVDRGTGAARAVHARYRALLDAAGIRAVEAGRAARQSAPYNLLVAREWMLLVPRVRDSFEGVPVNALGFAGSFFVRSAAEMEALRTTGPMTVLRNVAAPRPGPP